MPLHVPDSGITARRYGRSFRRRSIGLSGMPPEGAHAAALAFIEEYFEQAPTGGRERLPVQYAAAMVECAAGVFKRQEPHWAEKVAACVEEAKNAL